LKDSEKPQWWFNITTKSVELGLKSKALDRIGPFETKEDAEHALERVAERNLEWRTSEESDS
jgi:2-iminoacetate synthase ThiH